MQRSTSLGRWMPFLLFGFAALAVQIRPVQASDAPLFCLSPVEFVLDPRASMPDGLAGKLTLRPVGRDGEPIVVDARVGTPARTVVLCSTTWEVTPEFPAVWGPRQTVAASSAGEPVKSRLALWPMGKIAGSVKLAEKGGRPPGTIRVTTLAPRVRNPPPQPPPKGQMDCPVDAKGRWTCSLPAATYDLAFTAEGFSPEYRWGLQVLPGKVGEVGAIELKRGASVAGWVAVEEGAIDAGSCRARLTPLLGPGNGGQIAEKIQRTTVEARVAKDGFFQFGAVPPGTYSLEVRQKGFAPGTVLPIEVYPRSETLLREPVTLKRPFQLELAISPPLDWLDHRWKVEVSRVSSTAGTFRDETYHGLADEQGLVTVPGQAPGRFMLHVSDSRDNRLFAKILELGPAEARQTIDLKLLTVRGTIKLGTEPLAATLWFGGRFGSSNVELESDSEGKFHGVLPKDGWWIVDIHSPLPAFQLRTRAKVETVGRERGTVDIVLPATHLFGKVVMDDSGQPAPSADVSLSTDAASMSQRADETGSFDYRGLPAGTVYAAALLSSAKGEWTSDRVVFSIGEGEDHGPVELRLRKTRQISGLVQSPRGPVPGAGVAVVPFRPLVMFGDSVRTDLDGTFTGKVPAMIETAAAVVSAPGFALRAFALSVGEGPQTLSVSEEGGSLELRLPEKSSDAEKEDNVSLWIFQNGLPVPPDALYRWAVGHGNSPAEPGRNVTIPAVAPGEYRACTVAQAVLVQWEASGWAAPLATCTTGHLSTGGTLRLDLSKP